MTCPHDIQQGISYLSQCRDETCLGDKEILVPGQDPVTESLRLPLVRGDITAVGRTHHEGKGAALREEVPGQKNL